jgi:hypothetical protein
MYDTYILTETAVVPISGIHFVCFRILGDIPNTYAYTKALAEGLVSEQMDKLPVVILRPSIGKSSFCACVKLKHGWSYHTFVAGWHKRTLKGKVPSISSVRMFQPKTNILQRNKVVCVCVYVHPKFSFAGFIFTTFLNGKKWIHGRRHRHHWNSYILLVDYLLFFTGATALYGSWVSPVLS